MNAPGRGCPVPAGGHGNAVAITGTTHTTTPVASRVPGSHPLLNESPTILA